MRTAQGAAHPPQRHQPAYRHRSQPAPCAAGRRARARIESQRARASDVGYIEHAFVASALAVGQVDYVSDPPVKRAGAGRQLQQELTCPITERFRSARQRILLASYDELSGGPAGDSRFSRHETRILTAFDVGAEGFP